MTKLAPAVPQPLSAPLADDPMNVTIYRLDNGLTVYMSPNHETPRVFAEIVVRVGSKDDPSATTGLAHYLEHMLFKGTPSIGSTSYVKEKPHLNKIRALYEQRFRTWDPKKRAALDKQIDAENVAASKFEVPNEIDRIYQQLGFENVNANTSFDRTVFFSDFPSNRSHAWAAVESDRFANPVFRLFPTELEAVYEEKNRSIDNPDRAFEDALSRALYPQHPYGRDVLGEAAHLKNPSIETLYRFFKTYYVPNNMAIVLSGDFKPEEMLSLIKWRFGRLRPGPLPKKAVWPMPAPKGTKTVSISEEDEQTVAMSWPTVPYLSADEPALSVMDMIMDNEAAGIINLTLNQAQKVKQAGSGPSFLNDAGYWTVWAVPKKDQSLEEAKFLLLSTLLALKSGAFTNDDIKAVVTHIEVMDKEGLESNMSRAMKMAESFAANEPWPHAVRRLDALKKVTKADVLRVAKKYLDGNYVLAYRRLGKPALSHIEKPNFTPIKVDAAKLSPEGEKIVKLWAPKMTPKWLVEGQNYAETPLPCGKIYAAPNPFNDLFELEFAFDYGRRQERNLCAALKLWDLSGAGTLSADDFQKKLYALGSEVGVSCGEQEWRLTLRGLDRNLWPSLELVRERFLEPNVSADTLAQLVQVEEGAHKDNKVNPDSLRHALEEYALRGKDSAVLNELSDKEWEKLTVPELKELLQDAFSYRRRVGYVGNRNPGEVAKLLEETGRFKDPRPRKALRYVDPKAPVVHVLDRDMVQSQLGMALPDEVFDPKHVLDYQFYSGYIGGGMSSVIFQEVREARSLAYAASGGYASASHKDDQNRLAAGLGCQADKTAQAAELLAGILHEPPWSEERLNETKKFLEEKYRSEPVFFRAVPSTLMQWEDEGLPPGDPRPARFAKIPGYALLDLQGFATRFKDKPLITFLMGPEKLIGADSLKSLGSLELDTPDQLFPY